MLYIQTCIRFFNFSCKKSCVLSLFLPFMISWLADITEPAVRHFWRGPRYGRIPKAGIEHHSLLTTGIPRPCLHSMHTPPAFFTHVLLQTRLPSCRHVPTLSSAPFQYPLTLARPCSMFPQREKYLSCLSLVLSLQRSVALTATAHREKSKELPQTVLLWTNKQDQVESLTMWFFPQVGCIGSGR